jgi:uncharacterized protein YaiE (UPF0345 family)
VTVTATQPTTQFAASVTYANGTMDSANFSSSNTGAGTVSPAVVTNYSLDTHNLASGVNPSFETVSGSMPTHWSCDWHIISSGHQNGEVGTCSSNTTTVYDGSHSLRLANPSDRGATFAYSDCMQLTSGDTYDFGVEAKSDAKTPAGAVTITG